MNGHIHLSGVSFLIFGGYLLLWEAILLVVSIWLVNMPIGQALAALRG
jgi:hypothetical protein